MSCASCLVTSSPELEDPEQTAPELIASSAKPDLPEILVIEPGTSRVTFSAEVRSEQDLGQPIFVRLYVDYGVESARDQPVLDSFSGVELLPSSSAGPARRASVDAVIPDGFSGCHTYTLIVSHAFDQVTNCPERLADSSQLTWQALICDDTGPCPPPIGDPRLDCPVATQFCPEVPDDPTSGQGGGDGAP